MLLGNAMVSVTGLLSVVLRNGNRGGNVQHGAAAQLGRCSRFLHDGSTLLIPDISALRLGKSHLRGQQDSRPAEKGLGGSSCQKELPAPDSSGSTYTISASSVSLWLARSPVQEKLLRLSTNIDFRKKVCSVFW